MKKIILIAVSAIAVILGIWYYFNKKPVVKTVTVQHDTIDSVTGTLQNSTLNGNIIDTPLGQATDIKIPVPNADYTPSTKTADVIELTTPFIIKVSVKDSKGLPVANIDGSLHSIQNKNLPNQMEGSRYFTTDANGETSLSFSNVEFCNTVSFAEIIIPVSKLYQEGRLILPLPICQNESVSLTLKPAIPDIPYPNISGSTKSARYSNGYAFDTNIFIDLHTQESNVMIQQKFIPKDTTHKTLSTGGASASSLTTKSLTGSWLFGQLTGDYVPYGNSAYTYQLYITCARYTYTLNIDCMTNQDGTVTLSVANTVGVQNLTVK